MRHYKRIRSIQLKYFHSLVHQSSCARTLTCTHAKRGVIRVRLHCRLDGYSNIFNNGWLIYDCISRVVIYILRFRLSTLGFCRCLVAYAPAGIGRGRCSARSALINVGYEGRGGVCRKRRERKKKGKKALCQQMEWGLGRGQG